TTILLPSAGTPAPGLLPLRRRLRSTGGPRVFLRTVYRFSVLGGIEAASGPRGGRRHQASTRRTSGSSHQGWFHVLFVENGGRRTAGIGHHGTDRPRSSAGHPATPAATGPPAPATAAPAPTGSTAPTTTGAAAPAAARTAAPTTAGAAAPAATGAAAPAATG